MFLFCSPSNPPFLSPQCSSWGPVCWCTRSAWTPLWCGPSAGTLTSTTPGSVGSAGATCWLSWESCSPSSCPFLPNTRRRSTCPPPRCPRCYSALSGLNSLSLTRAGCHGETPASRFWRRFCSNIVFLHLLCDIYMECFTLQYYCVGYHFHQDLTGFEKKTTNMTGLAKIVFFSLGFLCDVNMCNIPKQTGGWPLKESGRMRCCGSVTRMCQ